MERIISDLGFSHTLAPDEHHVATKQSTPVSKEPDPITSRRQSKSLDPESAMGNLPRTQPHLQPHAMASMSTIDEVEEKPDLERVRTRLGMDEEEWAAADKARRNKRLNMQAIDALKQGTGQVKVDVKSVFMFLLRDGESY